MGNIKQINIKNCTYYFFNYMISIKEFDSGLVKTDKKSHKNIGIYNIGYITIKRFDDYENISSVNPLHLIIGEVNEYIEEIHGNKYLTFAFTDENKKVLKKYTELWNKIKYLIKTINSSKKVHMEKISCKSNLIQMIIYR